MGTTTFGNPGAPSSKTVNFDALFATSLANYRATLVDNISKSNAFWLMIKNNGLYQSENGGTNIEETLMYELGNADTYDGYDTLLMTPTDGVSRSLWEWRQASTPISISRKEERQNAQRLVNLLSTKIMQADMGFQEFMSTMLFHGAGAGALATPRTSASNGSTGLEPLSKLVALDPTASVEVGNINQSTSTWWRNRQKTSVATTYDAYLQEWENLYNTCSRGGGGAANRSPDIILTDQTSYELLRFALYQRDRTTPGSLQNFPFENIKFHRAVVVWDENVPDLANGTLDATAVGALGTAYFLNTKFMRIVYDSATNFIQTPFKTPANQDAKVAHIMWMGNITVNNRRKLGVLSSIARTLTVS